MAQSRSVDVSASRIRGCEAGDEKYALTFRTEAGKDFSGAFLHFWARLLFRNECIW